MLRVTKPPQPSGRPQARNSGTVRAHLSPSSRIPGTQQTAKEGPANGNDPLALLFLGSAALLSTAAVTSASVTVTAASERATAEFERATAEQIKAQSGVAKHYIAAGCPEEVDVSSTFTYQPLRDIVKASCAIKAPPVKDLDATQSISSQDAGVQSNQPLRVPSAVPMGYIGSSLFTMAALSGNIQIAVYFGLFGAACWAFVAVAILFQMWQSTLK